MTESKKRKGRPFASPKHIICISLDMDVFDDLLIMAQKSDKTVPKIAKMVIEKFVYENSLLLKRSEAPVTKTDKEFIEDPSSPTI